MTAKEEHLAHKVRELEDEVKEMKRQHTNACETIAKMHAAAVGKVCGPEFGIVEDVAALRKRYVDLLVERGA